MRSFFNRLYGNEKAKQRLSSAILSNTLNHALMICGPEGSGKKALATEICAALNCENKTDALSPLPCGRCNNCRRIYGDNYPDIKRLKRESTKATIGVEELRLLREDMFLSATESEYKIYIIEEADKMTPNAQNALLKVLEEPPRAVMILLLCEEADKILTTVKSRAQAITMQRFSAEQTVDYLVSRGKIQAEGKAKAIEDIMSADGRIGRAIEILTAPDTVKAERESVIAILKALRVGAPYSELYTAVNALPQKRAELGEALDTLSVALADLIKHKSDKNAPLTFFINAEAARELSEGISTKRLLSVYDAVRDAAIDNSRNANISALTSCLGAKIKLS